MQVHAGTVSLIWSVADQLRGDYSASDCANVILPFVLLRRLDCLLEPTRQAVLAESNKLPATMDSAMREMLLNRAACQCFHNTSEFTFNLLKDDPMEIEANLRTYVNGFSENVRDIFANRLGLLPQIARLSALNLLYIVVSRFAETDLHPDKISSEGIAYVFDQLIRRIRRLARQSNEATGQQDRLLEMVQLMIGLQLRGDPRLPAEHSTERDIID